MMAEDSLSRLQFVIQQEADADEMGAVQNILNEQNQLAGMTWAPAPLAVLIKDEKGVVVGGLTGSTNWGWLHIKILAVAKHLRGTGAGTKLLLDAEQAAREKGCQYSYVDTFSFQALGFYEKNDYEIFGVLDDFPRGAQRYFLRKKL